MILNGDCLDEMKKLENNSVDSIVTDPPYGLSFMGKKWDYDVPSKEVWIEALRVLKPGGHLLSFGGTRTYHRLAVNIEDAGFEIRDQIQWLYGSGFPKSHNIKEGEFKGFGTSLKPANEPICLARKPLEKGLTVAQNVLKYGTGALNIDASRIKYLSESDKASAIPQGRITFKDGSSGVGAVVGGVNNFEINRDEWATQMKGRWPANLLLDEEAAALLDEQSGPCKTGDLTGQPRVENKIYGSAANTLGTPRFYKSDAATGASRFFYVAKASKSERNKGLENEVKQKQGARPNSADNTGKFPDHDHRETGGNNHPTVKPIKLMEYLIRLVTPKNGVILDPFMGSGSTGVAAKNLGFNFIGIEISKEYVEIAEKRIGI